MGFLASYKRLPRGQRILLGLTAMVIGWYGPSWMSYLFLESKLAGSPKILPNSETDPPKH